MIPFSSVNRVHSKGHKPNFQRHHLIPLQAVSSPHLQELFALSPSLLVDLNDFATNGRLLPSRPYEALTSGLPLHRGPHYRYNELVICRLVQIMESAKRLRTSTLRNQHLIGGVRLLQSALYRGLGVSGFHKIRLNKWNPMHPVADFSDIDARVDALCSGSTHINEPEVTLKLAGNSPQFLNLLSEI